MRTILTIVLLLIAMIAVKTSNANSQDACTPKYVSCIDTCVAKKGGQDQCIAACQQKNDTCAAGVFGSTGSPEAATAEPANQQSEATEARDDGASPSTEELRKFVDAETLRWGKVLTEGELDAVIHSSIIKPILNKDPRVGRLWPDYKAEEARFFAKTGIFPIMHVMGIKQEIVDKHPEEAASVIRGWLTQRA